MLGEDEVSKEPQFEPLPSVRRKKPPSNPISKKTKEDKQNQKHHQNQIESRSRRGQARSKLTSKKKTEKHFVLYIMRKFPRKKTTKKEK